MPGSFRLLIAMTMLLTIGACAADTNSAPTREASQKGQLIASDMPRSTIVQLFNWPFSAIAAEACDLYAQGYSHVHVSPPQKSNSSTEWWGRYQPDDYRIDGPLGDEVAFRDMMRETERCGITVIVDLVLNHMANYNLDDSELYYPRGCSGSACLFSPENFHNAECIANYGDHCNVLYGRICGGGGDRGLPDLNTGHCESGGYLDVNSRNYDPHVLASAKHYVTYLQDLGVRAFRLDALKHMHPAFIEDLFSDHAIASRTDFVYGEVIAARANDPSLEVYRHIGILDFMDFPLTRTLIDAFSYGGSLSVLENVSGTDRALDQLHSVSFVTNHDVWGNEGGLGYRFSDFRDELLAHAYVLGRQEGIAYVYSEYDDGPSRRYRGIGEDYVRFHARDDISRMLAFRTQLLGEPTLPKWRSPTRLAFARGQRGLVAINKGERSWNVGAMQSGLRDGDYLDVLSGQGFAVVGGSIQGTVPARTALMLVDATLCTNVHCGL